MIDHEGVEDCVRRMRKTTYWAWPRGSRLFFWKFLKEWQEEARDGVPFWHLEPPQTRCMPNHRAESRDAKLATRKKLFNLRF